ncbi:MAG: hypothetical protein D6798_20860 [Deltaproteobacteria bacterium]|nr:MAG: hypothetical protein D6798_20860 [Deltaproteobacteria bacterium]
MALKITCPHCGTVRRLAQPYPLPGTELQCAGCGRGLAISYPPGMVERMRAKGVRFDDPYAEPDPGGGEPAAEGTASPPGAGPASRQAATEPFSAEDAPTRGVRGPAPVLRPPPPPPGLGDASPGLDDVDRTVVDRTVVERPRPLPSEATAIHVYGATDRDAGALVEPPATGGRPGGGPHPPPPEVRGMTPRDPGRAAPEDTAPLPPGRRPGAGTPGGRRRRGLLFRVVRAVVLLCLVGALAGGGVVAWAIHHYGADLPTVATLSDYRPPTVTVVEDRNGRLLGEIYEKRRYVVELEDIPEHVVDAFIAAEDANFWQHHGVDYMGIVRAVGRNLLKGRKAQGASTITQQVARNFLLSSEKTYERKIREILLSQRIEETFDKEHILYLYLNQIYLGSGAYGVEAAARTYFGKHIGDVTLAEAAILAGLPQRPSDYSPLRHWEKARARQEYVLEQMRAKGFIDGPTYEAALAEVVPIVTGSDEFMTNAPYFTEHIRRYLVDTYGFDKIYNDGLTVRSTCDLDLQRAAQQAVHDNVLRASNSIGWRGPSSTLDEDAITPHLADQEEELRQAESRRQLHVAAIDSGKGGYGPVPERSTLAVGEIYEGVVLASEKSHAIVGVGAHKVLVPGMWCKWMYKPDPERSYKSRVQRDVSAALHRGDVVQVRIEAETLDEVEDIGKLARTPGGPYLAGRIYQDPELEGALLSYRFSDGAVLAMVGGYSFAESEFNRATQAMRQVGSTFKPIVYAAAIGTRKITAGTLVQDAPTVFGVLGYGLYKPGNYGGKYLGHITVRRALQLSRNVVTVRILDRIGLEPVFELASALGIGFDEPSCSRTHVPQGSECEGTMTPSPVEGMAWCEYCDPRSCPLTAVRDGIECLSEPETRGDRTWCRSCDINLRACNWVPETQLGSRDQCLDPRLDEDSGKVMCRACDLSMGLGSSSLTMLELGRAYSAFATYGHRVEPHWIDQVIDRDGTVIEQYEPPDDGWPVVMNPSVAAITHWLLREVATGGTGARSNRLGIHVAGKTGTTNDFKDAWFVGYNTELLAAAWVGYDKPRSMGVSFTGGDTALPVWMDYMRVAAPKDQDKDFPPLPGVEMVPIDETTGRVATGGRLIPMLPGTAPTNVVGQIGQKTAEDLLTTDF